MTLDFELISSLPTLSWCARARARAPVRVRHGPGVETRDDGFVEGAWDGEFDAFNFDRTQTLAGSGARLREGMLVFATPFHPLECLFVLRAGGDTLISNSLGFVLGEAGDGLDMAHPNYFFDLVAQVRRGISIQPARLRTASGNHVELFRGCNLELNEDRRLRMTPKLLGPPPASYADYFGLLRRTTELVAGNAQAMTRITRYRLVAACSRGYDSTASAALASLAGCREGVTFIRSARVTGHPLLGTAATIVDDSGAESLRALGMNVMEFDRAEMAKLSGHPKAEFYMSPSATTDAATRLMEHSISRTLLVSGRHGERYWGPTSRCKRRNFREVDDCSLSGRALGEFRMRTGFLHFPIPYVGALHGPAIFRITHAPEMRPWKLETGYYDRPIARRIAEEAGVPRSSFGQRKLGAGLLFSEMSPASEQDFRAFLQSAVPEPIRRRLHSTPHHTLRIRHRRLTYVRTHYAHWPMVGRMLDVLQTDRLHYLWNSTRLYEFHWGFERIKGRYAY